MASTTGDTAVAQDKSCPGEFRILGRRWAWVERTVIGLVLMGITMEVEIKGCGVLGGRQEWEMPGP